MSPTHPDTFYAQTKRSAEQIFLNARGADGQPLGTVLRLGAVYGSRIKGNYERLTRALAGNWGGNLGRRSVKCRHEEDIFGDTFGAGRTKRL